LKVHNLEGQRFGKLKVLRFDDTILPVQRFGVAKSRVQKSCFNFVLQIKLENIRQFFKKIFYDIFYVTKFFK